MCSPKKRRATPRTYLRNLRRPMQLRRKVRLLLRNLTIRATRLSMCCGHPGEPGC